MQVATQSGRSAEPVLRGLGVAGVVMIVVGIGMLLMPFVGPLVGLPFDGAEAWVLDRNRFLLHVFPGIVGALAGVALLRAQRARTRDGIYPDWLKPAIAIAVIIGIWDGVGPWVMDNVLPTTAGTSLMFTSIPGFGGMSEAEQVTLQLVCHWLPAALALGAAAVAWAAVRRLPRRSSATA